MAEHIHLTPQEARVCARGKDLDPSRLEGVLLKRKRGGKYVQGCQQCTESLFQAFNGVLTVAEEKGGHVAEDAIDRVREYWKQSIFCPPNLLEREKTLAVRRHLQYCKICSLQLEIAARDPRRGNKKVTTVISPERE